MNPFSEPLPWWTWVLGTTMLWGPFALLGLVIGAEATYRGYGRFKQYLKAPKQMSLF